MIKINDKKGVSPLIAWVLIISFAIAMALLVTKWVVDNVENVEFGEDDQLYCKDISIFITDVCKTNQDKIQISMTNNGNFKVDRLSIGMETTHKPESWCLKLNVQGFNPQSSYQYLLPFGEMTGRLIGDETSVYQDCDTIVQEVPQPGEIIKKIAIVPWIKIEGRPISCIEKKVELNQNIQNCPPP